MEKQIFYESQFEVQNKNLTVETPINIDPLIEVKVQTEKSEVEDSTYNEPQIVDEKKIEITEKAKPDYNEPYIVIGNEKRKPAFASFNRAINLKNVAIIQEKIQEKGYRVGEPIQVLKAENIISTIKSPLQDINKKEIPEDKINLYYLVVDGQHRTFAVTLYNEWAKTENVEEIFIPAIEVTLINGETVTEYCNEINITKKEWSREDGLTPYFLDSFN